MPYPSQISYESIVSTARTMIEADTLDRLSMNKLAAKLGVKTPSLYRYVRNRVDLLRAINEETQTALFEAVEPALNSEGTAKERLMAMADAYWEFAHEHPATYGMLYTNTIDELRPNIEEAEKVIVVYQNLLAEICGQDKSQAALRGLLAIEHGFIMLHLSGQYWRGNGHKTDFLSSVSAYLDGLG